jgi:thioredoxin reductase (NADPH)
LSETQTFAPGLASRAHQAFPELTPEQIERMAPLGVRRTWSDGELLFEAGKPGPGLFVVLKGEVAISRRDGLGNDVPVVNQGVGQFLAEVGQLSSKPAFVDGRAMGEVEALLLDSEALRTLLVAEAEIGELIMRALILRRVNLIETGAGGPTLIGHADAPEMVRHQRLPDAQRPALHDRGPLGQRDRRGDRRPLPTVGRRRRARRLPQRLALSQPDRDRDRQGDRAVGVRLGPDL